MFSFGGTVVHYNHVYNINDMTLTLYKFPSFGHFTRIRDPTRIFFMIVALTRDDTRLSSLTAGLDFGLRGDLIKQT